MTYDRVERLLNQHRRGIINGKELVDNVFDSLAYEAQFERVPDVTATLLTHDTAEVLEWLNWVEPLCNDPQWVPFPIDTRLGPTEADRRMRENYRKVAELVKVTLQKDRSRAEERGI